MAARMIRLVLAVVGGLCAVPPIAGAQEMTPHEAALYQAAKSEGSVTWYVSQYLTATVEKLGQGFSERYPGLKVNAIRSTAQVAYSRLMQDIKAKVPQCDVFSATDFSHAQALKKLNQVLKYVPDSAAGLEPSLRGLDPEGYLHASSVNPTVMAYNTNLVAAQDIPTNWTDLVDPKWKGKAAISHPGFSGSTGGWALMMEKLYGNDFFARLAKNNPLMTRSLGDPPSAVSSGERQIAITSYSSVVALKARGNPIEAVFPTDGAKLTRGPSFILVNAPHPNAAKLFMEFFLSVPASKILAANGYPPIRPEVQPPEGARRVSEIKLGPLDEDDIAGIPELIERFRVAFGN